MEPLVVADQAVERDQLAEREQVHLRPALAERRIGPERLAHRLRRQLAAHRVADHQDLVGVAGLVGLHQLVGDLGAALVDRIGALAGADRADHPPAQPGHVDVAVDQPPRREQRQRQQQRRQAEREGRPAQRPRQGRAAEAEGGDHPGEQQQEQARQHHRRHRGDEHHRRVPQAHLHDAVAEIGGHRPPEADKQPGLVLGPGGADDVVPLQEHPVGAGLLAAIVGLHAPAGRDCVELGQRSRLDLRPGQGRLARGLLGEDGVVLARARRVEPGQVVEPPAAHPRALPPFQPGRRRLSARIRRHPL